MEQRSSEPSGILLTDLRPQINRERAIRWFGEVWNERRTETIDELFPADAIGHTENGDQGPAGFKAAVLGSAFAFIIIVIAQRGGALASW